MSNDPLAGIQISKFTKARQTGFEISFHDLFDIAENVLGKTVEEAVHCASIKSPDNTREFWMHIDDYASQDQTFDINLKKWFDDQTENYQYIFGENWVYKPVAELSPEEIKLLEFDDHPRRNSAQSHYLYYPVMEAIVKGLGDYANKKLRIYYDW